MDNSATKFGAILLGAGFGRRFGSDKRLAKLGDTTVAEATAITYAKMFEHLRFVIRPEDAVLRERLTPYGEIIAADQAHLGMGHSLAAGIKTVAQNSASARAAARTGDGDEGSNKDGDWHWAFVGLLDMPFVADATLHRLQQAAGITTRRILRPRLPHSMPAHDATPHGHPVGFHCSLFAEISNLTGDQGARAILQRHLQDVEEVILNDRGIVQDVDRPEDLPV